MKSYAVIALLLLNSVQAVKLQSPDDIDPDDQELSDGQFKSEQDVAIFQQTFVNEGQSVKDIKRHVRDEARAAEAGMNENPAPVPLPNILKKLQNPGQDQPVQQQLPQEAVQKTFEQQQAESIAQFKATHPENIETVQELENTKMWANAQEGHEKEKQQQLSQQVATENMGYNEKSALFHNVVKSAQKQIEEEANPKPAKVTEDDLHKDRIRTAEEIDQTAIDLEKMSFTAKDLNNFSSFAQQNAGKQFEERQQVEDKKSAKPAEKKVEEKKPSKNFYEQIYDQKAQDTKPVKK